MNSDVKKIKELLARTEWSQGRLARETKTSASHISTLLKGKHKPNESTVERMVAVMEAELAERESPQPVLNGAADKTGQLVRDLHRIPFDTMVQGGDFRDYERGLYADDSLPGCLYPYINQLPIALIVSGNSMSPKIDAGDVVILARNFHRPPRTEDVVVLTLKRGNGSTIKTLQVIDAKTWRLIPKNKQEHEEIIVKTDEVDTCYVVVGCWKPYKTVWK